MPVKSKTPLTEWDKFALETISNCELTLKTERPWGDHAEMPGVTQVEAKLTGDESTLSEDLFGMNPESRLRVFPGLTEEKFQDICKGASHFPDLVVATLTGVIFNHQRHRILPMMYDDFMAETSQMIPHLFTDSGTATKTHRDCVLGGRMSKRNLYVLTIDIHEGFRGHRLGIQLVEAVAEQLLTPGQDILSMLVASPTDDHDRLARYFANGSAVIHGHILQTSTLDPDNIVSGFGEYPAVIAAYGVR